jgi:hypothetical protein
MATAINDKVPALRAMPVVAGSLRQLFSPFAASRRPHSPMFSHAVPIAQHKGRRYGFEVGSAVSVGVLTDAADETAFFRA